MNAMTDTKAPTTAVAPINAPHLQAIAKAEARFVEMAAAHGEVNWPAEVNYARQILEKNTALQKADAGSIRDAMINVGAIGLSLSPAEQLAYLVPRGNLCCLDVSYRGLIKLATDSGACTYVRADVVHESDADGFTYRGPAALPGVEVANPFGSSGEIVGAYAIARLSSGDVLCEILRPADIKAIQATSKGGVWSGPWRPEMIKKAAIKRLCKTIPRPKGTDGSRLSAAIRVLNEHEGIDTENRSPIALAMVPSGGARLDERQQSTLVDLLDQAEEVAPGERERFDALCATRYEPADGPLGWEIPSSHFTRHANALRSVLATQEEG